MRYEMEKRWNVEDFFFFRYNELIICLKLWHLYDWIIEFEDSCCISLKMSSLLWLFDQIIKWKQKTDGWII